MTKLKYIIGLVMSSVLLSFGATSAQDNPSILTLNVIDGTVEVALEGSSDYVPVESPSQLQTGDRVRWSADATGEITGPSNFTVPILGDRFGSGELEIASYSQEDVESGIRIRQLSGYIPYSRETQLDDLNEFISLSFREQEDICEARVEAQAERLNNRTEIEERISETLENPFVEIVDANEKNIAYFTSAWTFVSVDEDGILDNSGWTDDADVEFQLEAGVIVRPDISVVEYTVIDRACENVLDQQETASLDRTFIHQSSTRRMSRPSRMLSAPVYQFQFTPSPGTTFTFSFIGGVLTIDLSSGGGATFVVTDPPLPYDVVVNVDGYSLDIDEDENGASSISSNGSGTVTATGTGGGGGVTTPQGVRIDLSEENPNNNFANQAVITDTGSGNVNITANSGDIGVETTATTGAAITLPGGTTVTADPGENFNVQVNDDIGSFDIENEPGSGGSVEVTDPDNNTTTIPPGGDSGALCPDGNPPPSGLGGACGP